MTLTTEQMMLVEQRLNNDKKSAVVAYLLWFFVGFLGGHRFYLGRTGSAVTQLLLFIGGLLLSVVGVGIVLLVALVIWVLVDAFLIPGSIERDTTERRRRISGELALMVR